MAYAGTTFSVPKELSPGRYLVSFTVKDYPGTAGAGDAGKPENLGWIPLISTWHTTGKKNIEAALAAKGIYATAVEVKNMVWGPARRGGTLDVFGLSPWIQDFSFDLVIDLTGAVQGGGLQGFQRTGAGTFSGQLGALPLLVYIGGAALVVGLGSAIASLFGKGDVVITALRLIVKYAAEAVGAVVGGAVEGLGSGLGLPAVLILGGLAALWVLKSPRGKALKSAAWG